MVSWEGGSFCEMNDPQPVGGLQSLSTGLWEVRQTLILAVIKGQKNVSSGDVFTDVTQLS